MKNNPEPQPKKSSVFSLLAPYRGLLILLVLLALASNAITLLIPKLVAVTIDHYAAHTLVIHQTIVWFTVAAIGIFVLTYAQNVVQIYASERVARDTRNELMRKISLQNFSYIQTANPSVLLTNITSDSDAIKRFVAQAIVSMVSSVFVIIGSSALLLSLNWKLALCVMAIIPIIGGSFFLVLGRVRPLFLKTQGIIDRLNKVINESILGAALIRVLNSQQYEYQKFVTVNTEAKENGLHIVTFFAALIPIISFVANLAIVAVLFIGGKSVIFGSMTIGDFTAFNSYIAILIFPILVIGFMSNVIAQANASYERLEKVLKAPLPEERGNTTTPLTGAIEVQNVTIRYGEKLALQNVSMAIRPGTKNAIIGPTAAGKTQLLYAMTGLMKPTEGTIEYDNIPLQEYDQKALHAQIGFVFQDSIIFNTTVRENIAFSTAVTETDMMKAIETAELEDLIASLPQGLETVVSERGANLSGGQKQRIMLARALALNPKILLLDDFTARVDTRTEQSILNNVTQNYPDLTLISITQKIASIEQYDSIFVIMEGELLAQGTHEQLMHSSPEYVQIYQSQQSIEHNELHA
ncbi:MAG TPA: ABC transporter ATP-binding protein [Candidatus Paceibacterota bacterium]|jgi:ATP-binding cassette subfamily B protein|nr:ABC transporter ATP-binding protein [Candidatus Paceibacterota bacterium]